ncbi:alpha-N-acetylgalactosaminide alpha-2,6-sialyltransferase 6 [Callorhinchus milii]|uniref:alpha-N-acetylgalactosaminide alpha-2,6-sialyltransferase 6 n=1 Tax=Callorhinchus milii TaxID=7868 RepID=UPI0004575A2E|nr:alpha-N-acetylgalactosaminide alpha-2,6-sialyltransferase 6 [Callorhinchus milii]XP_007898510.1 alpha-N-acetylgalactosaminide alpha-2,6-sialyltransferase 6 [Callorhinchus milii]XP_042193456.1 alpha-N-acetylgalactosaminide alpha-2,6-sialyltransferase 6 [Callorhinchus milii]|eukprot:gi/632964670/ref/XP_007898509.1/ PREDICTED: alpha-N-acetylgalactosaminide alpha-2,6-sialyltransferase 6 [Callorhinchus milii]
MNNKAQRFMIATVIFVLTTLLIVYSSTSGNSSFYLKEDVGYKFIARQSSNLKEWNVQDGYIPVIGNKTLKLHCSQCALISSSSQTLGTSLGSEIDQTECIIRMNDAPITGYEEDIGNRTTLRVVAHSSISQFLKRRKEFLQRGQETIFIFWGPYSRMRRDGKSNVFRIIKQEIAIGANMSVFTVSPKRMKQFDDLFQMETGQDRKQSHSWLSTGWFTMVIAVGICDSLHVYGMIPYNHCRKPHHKNLPYHYYNTKSNDECATYLTHEHARMGNHHRFITEKHVFARWAEHYNITFSHPSW